MLFPLELNRAQTETWQIKDITSTSEHFMALFLAKVVQIQGLSQKNGY